MPLVEIVQSLCEKEMRELADTIEGELKAACPVQSGEARASIHVEQKSATSYRIGAANLHLFFADQGNNQSTQLIRPVRAKALRFTDGSFHGSARTYKGKHFVKAVADRHR